MSATYKPLNKLEFTHLLAAIFLLGLCFRGWADTHLTATLQGARIFYLPLDGSFEAVEAGGKKTPEIRGTPQFVQGKKGRAGSFTEAANLVFDAEGNFDQGEGSAAMYIMPYWPNSDGIPHCFLEVPVGPELFTDGGFVITKGWSTGVMPNLSYFYNSPGHHHISGGREFKANEWSHVVFTWSQSKGLLQLFWNGELAATQKYEQFQDRPSPAGRVLVVGARLGGSSVRETDKGIYHGKLAREFPLIGGDSADAAIDELMIFNRALTSVEVANLLGTTPREAPSVEPLNPTHVNQISTRLETPHIRFGRPLAGGPIKTLFICPVQLSGAGRDVVELAQRFDIDFNAVTSWYPWTLGYDKAYFRMWKDTSSTEKIEAILDGLRDGPEALVIANVIYSKFPAHLHQAILGHVKAGMGLVVTAPRQLNTDLQPGITTPSGGDSQIADAHKTILQGVPLEALTEFFPKTKLSLEERAEKAVKGYQIGKGRVVTIRWALEEAPEGEGFEGLAPVAAGGQWTRQYEHRYNYHIGVVAKALLWATGRDPQATWTNLPEDGQSIPRVQLSTKNFEIGLDWDSRKTTTATLAATIRDALGNEKEKRKVALLLRPGPNKTSLPLPALKHGLHYLELVLSAGAKVQNWATISFHVDGPGRIVDVTAERGHYEKGQAVSGTVTFAGKLKESAQLLVHLKDTNNRVYNKVSAPVSSGSKSVPFELSADRPTTLATYIEAELICNHETISYGDTTIFIPKRDFAGFVSTLWCTIANPGIGQVALRKIREAGFNTIYHWGNQCGDFHNDAMADLMPSQYCTRITLTPDARGWPTGNVGDGRLDPKRNQFKEQFRKEVQASMPLGPPYYSLGDENHFQFGIGFSPYELEAFAQFLEARYDTIEHLNQEYQSKYHTFSDVPRYQESDAIREGVIPALIDHRMGTDDEYVRYHHELVKEIRQLDPHARVGAEGSMAGNMERMLEGVQMWAPYGDNILLRSLASEDHLVSHWWAGLSYGPEDCTKLWTYLIRGFANYQQFFCALHIDGALLNVDYSYRPFFRNLLPELNQINNGPALMLRDAEVVSKNSISIHWSRESEHASFALKDLGSTESSRNTLAQTLDRSSRDYRYISSKQILAGQLESPKADILFLPASHVMDQATAAAIEEYARGGGTVVADFLPSLNEFGRRLAKGRLDELFGATCKGKTNPAIVNNLSINTTISNQTLQLTCPRTVAHNDVTAQTAHIVVPDQEVPLMLVNEVGQGRAILLNFDLARCSQEQRSGFVTSLLAIAGATPHCRLTKAPPETQYSLLRRGTTTLLGLVFPQNTAPAAKINWETPQHVYNVRTGTYLGKRETLTISHHRNIQRVHLFSMQTSPVAGINLHAAKSTPQGINFPVKVELRFMDNSLQPSDRVIRIDVENPDGNPIMYYRKFVTLKGNFSEFEIPFAHNDALGTWTLTATDVATGTTSKTSVALVSENGRR